MKVQIIGLGTVGNAQAFLGSRLGHQMFGFDTRPGLQSPHATPLERPEREVDLTFICVPESAVEGVLQGLVRDQVKGLYVIKSTVPPGTTERLSRSLGVHICHNPEFLRQEHALEDVMRPGRVVIGQCCAGHGEILERLYSPLGVPIHITDPATSELVKITTNALRAMAITFWNELDELSVGLGVRTDAVARMVDQAKALGEWEGGNWGVSFFGRPYGRACLPKDMDQLIGVFRRQGLNPVLLEAVRRAEVRDSVATD